MIIKITYKIVHLVFVDVNSLPLPLVRSGYQKNTAYIKRLKDAVIEKLEKNEERPYLHSSFNPLFINLIKLKKKQITLP